MDQSKDKIKNILLYLADITSLFISYIVSGWLWLVIYKGFEEEYIVSDKLGIEVGAMIISYAFIILFFNANQNFFKRDWLNELFNVIKTNVMFASLFVVILFAKRSADAFSRGVYFLTIFLNIVIMYILHVLVKYYLTKVRIKSKRIDRVLIITYSDRAEDIIKRVRKRSEYNRNIDGIVILDKDMSGETILDYPVVANRDDIIDYVKLQVMDEVLLDMPANEYKRMRKDIMELESMGVIVSMSITQLREFEEYKTTIGMIGDVPVVRFASVFHDYNKLLVKRLIDIVGALVGIAITLVVTIFLAPILLIESPGPLFFKQKRVGRNGRFFYMYKFRSMYRDAEARKKELMDKNEMNGLMFKMTDDPRITKVGKFIRKTSIDELPQFFNVLKGDMSLVGTRPPTVDEFKQYEGHHKRRLSMKPGITGLWQVSGRSDIEDFEEVVMLDLKYIDNWCVTEDIKILIKTVKVIIFGSGAR
ncbi:MAG: sugar transferase [Lachnospiraceae bacterium]|nr:sugar transferase [Lachnospiraceae bacterium]